MKKIFIQIFSRLHNRKRYLKSLLKIPYVGINFRKKIHNFLLTLLIFDRKLETKEVIHVEGDYEKNSTPKIFACTHIGGNDIQRVFEAIKEPAYLFLGDPRELYFDLAGIWLFLNGVVAVDTDDKCDRKIAYNRAKEIIKKGASLLIFPEGVWNITDNLPVLNLYGGAVRLAMETGAEIVPIAIEQYENDIFINIGGNYTISETCDYKSELKSLRDCLATLKWKIFERQPICKRKTIPDNYANNLVKSIFDRCPYSFTIDDVNRTMKMSEI